MIRVLLTFLGQALIAVGSSSVFNIDLRCISRGHQMHNCYLHCKFPKIFILIHNRNYLLLYLLRVKISCGIYLTYIHILTVERPNDSVFFDF